MATKEHVIRLTKEELQERKGLRKIYKTAIEHAIYEMVTPNDPEDAVWPDFFRAEVVNMEAECLPKDSLKDDEYDTEACWFQEGWMARAKI